MKSKREGEEFPPVQMRSPCCLSRTDAEQLCEHQAGSGEADEEDTLGGPGLQTSGPVDDGGLPVRAGET